VSTADIYKKSEIVHISAVPVDKEVPIFERFIYPQDRISDEASRIHRITREDGKLLKRGKVVDDVDPFEAYDDFVDWIDEHLKRRTGDRVRLIGHDVLEYDAHVLVYNLKREDKKYRGRNCDRICDRIDSFSDTVVSFRHFYRNVKNYQVDNKISRNQG
jgi:DNA polymerase III epsilon subunit-like protein